MSHKLEGKNMMEEHLGVFQACLGGFWMAQSCLGVRIGHVALAYVFEQVSAILEGWCLKQWLTNKVGAH